MIYAPRMPMAGRSECCGTAERTSGHLLSSASIGRGIATVGLLLALGACGDNLLPRPDPYVGDDQDEYQPGRVGLISLVGGAGGLVAAVLQDRGEPLLPVVKAREGGCAIYTRPVEGSCTPGCKGEVCTNSNECTPVAKPVSAGVITVTGLRQGLIFRPGPAGYVPESQPPIELFDSGARIHVSAPGAIVEGFSVDLSGVPRLEVSFDRITLTRGKDTRLTWTAAGVGRISIAVVIAAAGSPFSSMLLCEGDDNGSLSMPGSLAAKLPEPHLDETQVATITRLQRVVLASATGPIEVVAGSQVPVEIERR
jgi:hypothetical protein